MHGVEIITWLEERSSGGEPADRAAARRTRRHSALGYLSPVEWEEQLMRAA